NGKYRKIEVKLSTDDVKLEYRRGYYALSGTEINKSQNIQLLAAAMQPSVPECTMLLLRVQVLPPEGDRKFVTIDYAVAPADVSFAEGDDHQKHAQLDFMASAWDKDKEVTHVVTPIDFHIRKEMYAEVNRTGIPGHQELELKPGTYLLRVGVMD